VARNRKRAKERRARRPESVAAARSQLESDAPSPIGHASADVDLAEAQMALGRPELIGDEAESEPGDEEFVASGEDDSGALGGRSGGAGGGGSGAGSGGGGSGGALAVPEVPGAPERAPRAWAGARLLNFLAGSWRELQRVQWPDRRQVVQATGVVIGFVIVAGVFLGVADWAATKITNLVLTGHW
jgi:preprotein translocase subunit SecE